QIHGFCAAVPMVRIHLPPAKSRANPGSLQFCCDRGAVPMVRKQRVMQTFGSSRDDANKLHIAREPIGENGGRQTRGLRRLRIFGRQDKLRADRSKGPETWA